MKTFKGTTKRPSKNKSKNCLQWKSQRTSQRAIYRTIWARLEAVYSVPVAPKGQKKNAFSHLSTKLTQLHSKSEETLGRP